MHIEGLRQKCRYCQADAVPGRTMCAKHLEKSRVNSARARKAKLDKGLCADCGKRPLHTKHRCKVCARKLSVWMRKRQQQNIGAGLCIVSGCVDPRVTNKHCRKHAAGFAESQKRRIAKFHTKGLCGCCGREISAWRKVQGYKTCGKCVASTRGA
jgi:hypothetical protein